MKLRVPKYKLFFTLFQILPLFLLTVSGSQPPLKLISPVGDIVIPNNAPSLTWTAVSCKYYTVWIDGVLMDSIRSTQHVCVPFPLSFGKHTWQVIAIDGKSQIKSETGSFIIDDKPLGNFSEGAQLLRYGWKVQSSLLTKETGAEISDIKTNTQGWYSTSIPATVLSVLVRNGVYPNPLVGLNNMRIPDSNDKYNTTYGLLKYSHISGHNPWKDPYWFRTEFEIPKSYKGKTVWLTFSEINYKAEVWLNGNKIADTTVMAGMERSFRFEVTEFLKEGVKNYLAVAIYPVDVPGEPASEPITPLGEPGTNMGDGGISKNYTKWDAIGWDWQPAIRDREMGITEDVYLEATNVVEITDLYVTSDLPLPDTSSADITISASIINHSNKIQTGLLKAYVLIDKEEFVFDQPYTVGPNQAQSILWNNKNVPQLHLQNPKLWWPFGYGKQNLYNLRVEVISGKEVVANIRTNFGIREVETYIGSNERVYKVNGHEIYCKGGNWVIDMMLNWNAKRYEDEILLTRNSNLNMLRIWGPTGVPPTAFFEAADNYGVLLWQDFLNDFWGTFKNTPGLTPNDSVFEKVTIAIVKKLRNHPSLIIWCGGNEGPNPREALIMNKILPQFDGRSSRHYLKISNGDGLHGGGPYHTLSPEEYFTTKKLSGFSSEIGPSGVPVFESIAKFMPNMGKTWMAGRFPIDHYWAYHDANDWPGSDTRKFSSYDNIIRQQYGAPAINDMNGIVDYLNKAQLLNYDVYRSCIESINKQLWSNASGILLWKSNSSWPSITWQLYDWYLQAHAGYYGAQSAGEPLHIQLNRDKMDVDVLNTYHREIDDAQISAILYNTSLEQLWNAEDTVHLSKNSVYKTGWIVPVTEQLCFLKLLAKDKQGNIVSDNFYWLSTIKDYGALKTMKPANLTGSVSKTNEDGRTRYILKLTNTGDNLAFMVGCKMLGKTSENEILPSVWNRNYVSLLPNETVQLEVEINNLDLVEESIISCKAYNMEKPLIVVVK